MLKLTEFENKVFELIKNQGELQISNIPKRMLGAIPNLKNAGLVKTFKKPTTKWASKKHTFVKAIEK
ncbi:MAG: hypothetical protein P8X97_06260 [Candidatus Bathyarchaeota archaeon]